MTSLLYGGAELSKAEVNYLPASATQYLIGKPESEGEKGILDGNPAALRDAPEYTNVGATLDEAKHDQVANCMFITLTEDQHEVLLGKTKDYPEWSEFNHDHWNVVVTLKPPRQIPVDTAAMTKGKLAKKRTKEKQLSGLVKGKKAKASTNTVTVSSLNEEVSSTDNVIIAHPIEVKPFPTLDEVQEVNTLRLMEYFNELDEKSNKFTLTWCDAAYFQLYLQYQKDEIPFTLQGSACRKILS